MTRPTAILLAVVATVITVPAVLAHGPAGFVVVTIGVGVGYGIGCLVDWLVDHGEERYP
jgi:hypothetical protein